MGFLQFPNRFTVIARDAGDWLPKLNKYSARFDIGCWQAFFADKYGIECALHRVDDTLIGTIARIDRPNYDVVISETILYDGATTLSPIDENVYRLAYVKLFTYTLNYIQRYNVKLKTPERVGA